MRKKAFTIVELAVVICIIGILSAIVFPVFNRTYCNPIHENCRSNFKQLGFAIRQYGQDYDAKLPLDTESTKQAWAVSLHPYLKTWNYFQCGATKGHQAGTTDYYFNKNLAGLEHRFAFSDKVVLAGEGIDDAAPSFMIGDLLPEWRNSSAKATNRHRFRSNYLMADGHTKWVSFDQIVSGGVPGGNLSFTVYIGKS